MAFKIVDCDNVREYLTGSGTTLSLGGALPFSRGFAAVLANGDTSFVVARKGGEMSVGIFTYSSAGAGSFAQTEVWYSTNADAAVTFSSGTGEIYIDVPARLFDHLNFAEITVASAATTDIGAAQGARVAVSGTTGITSFGSAVNKLRYVRFTGALTMTHHATSLILQGAVNRTTAAGDVGIYVSDASGNWREISYQDVSGHKVRGNETVSGTLAVTGASTFTGAASFVAVPGVRYNAGTGAGIWLDDSVAGNRFFFGGNAGAVDQFRLYSTLAGTNVLVLTPSATLALSATALEGVLGVKGTTASTSTTTGALTVAGGVGVGGDINWTGAAWTAYTPTVTAGSGSITSYTATGAYKQFGKFVIARIKITFTNSGTLATYFTVSTPVTPIGAGASIGSLSAYNETALGGYFGEVTNSFVVVGAPATGDVVLLTVMYEST